MSIMYDTKSLYSILPFRYYNASHARSNNDNVPKLLDFCSFVMYFQYGHVYFRFVLSSTMLGAQPKKIQCFFS